MFNCDETDVFFDRLEKDEERIMTEYRRITHKVTEILQAEQYEQLAAFFQYFQEGIGREVYLYCSAIQKLSAISQIVMIELETGKFVFASGTYNYLELMQKYQRLAYYLRRFEFLESEESCKEGIEFLITNQISIVAIMQVLKREVFPRKKIVAERCAYMLTGKDEKIEAELLAYLTQISVQTK